MVGRKGRIGKLKSPVNVSVQLEAETHQELDKIATEESLTISGIIRTVVLEHLMARGKRVDETHSAGRPIPPL